MNFEFRMPPLGLANKNIFSLEKKWKEVLQLVAFWDTGGTFLHGGPNTVETGVGCGFRLKLPFQTAISFDMGIPLNHKSRSHPVFLYFKLTGAPF
jgi:outer membrane translocation and assembly module TamA